MSETTIPQCYVVGAKDPAAGLRTLAEEFAKSDGEVVIEFSGIRRIGTDVLHELEALAKLAHARKTKIALRGVDVTVYKVLKLAGLASQFNFTA